MTSLLVRYVEKENQTESRCCCFFLGGGRSVDLFFLTSYCKNANKAFLHFLLSRLFRKHSF